MAENYRLMYGGTPLSPVEAAGGRKIYCFRDADGIGERTVFQVFPGIDLIFDDYARTECDCRLEAGPGELLELRYCHAGRLECRWVCGDYLYLGAGDLCITRMEQGQPPMSLPTGRYQGVTVVLDMERLRRGELPVIGAHKPELDRLGEKFCPGHHFFAMRANAHIAHIFSELYGNISEAVREDYYKIKVLELLMFLLMVDPEEERRVERITKGQIDVVKAVRDRLCQDLGRELTIEQLAREFLISPTALKSNFKLVYGSSVKEYLRRVRMDHAALRLRTGSLPVAEIARLLGYASQSKFAAAFKEAYELSPTEYRRKCTHEGEEQAPGVPR